MTAAFASFSIRVRVAGGSRARRLARQWVEGFHAADPRIASVHALADGGWPADDVEERRLGRVIDGYARVVEWLATPLAARIRLGAVVTRVRWQPGKVEVQVQHPDRRPRFAIEARAAVIAVPLGVLKASSDEVGAIEFLPALDGKQQAVNQLAVGSVVRVVPVARTFLGPGARQPQLPSFQRP